MIEVTLPSLRERPADILPLAEHLLGFFRPAKRQGIRGFAEPVRDALLRYPWPGNIRELRNAVERGVILAAGPLIEMEHLPAQIGNAPRLAAAAAASLTLDDLECDHIRRVLATAPTIEDAAATLGIDPSTLYRKRKRFGI